MNPHIVRVIALLGAFLFCGMSHGQALKPGTYNYRAYGELTIEKPSASGSQKFHIYSDGANGHICDFEGFISNTVATFTEDDMKQCVINFQQNSDLSIKVFIDEARYPKAFSTCRNYCGARAGFVDTYKIRSATCQPKRINIHRNNFLNFYKVKKYKEALEILTTLKSQCSEWLHWTTEFDIANDTAITFYHLGQQQQCLDVLKPYVNAANKPVGSPEIDNDFEDEGVWELIGIQPTFYEMGYKALKAIRTNLRLCGHKFPKN